MNKLIIASAAAALMMGISGSAFAAMSAADCQSLFQRADISKDGSLQADEAKVFLDAMNQAQVKPKDISMVTKDEFTMACEKDAFANIDPATIGTAVSTTATTDQGTTTTEQPAASTTTTTEQSTTATTEQPAATAEQSTTATTEQPAATAEQSTTATTDQPATTEQPATDQTASTEPTTEQPATTSGEQALAAPSGLLASNLIGTTVYSADDQSIGDINDIILPPDGSQPMQVIVGVGGFLGMGEKDVVLDMSKLSFVTTDNGNLKVVAQTSQEELKNMPAFSKQPAQQ
ncbi:MAG TPA: PRC-barrel domain-containing protein [Aestuariivirgaceae bacterium]|nr:PRC-barrel domain-containing protein [Aestuariivirgaceae bacterium]